MTLQALPYPVILKPWWAVDFNFFATPGSPQAVTFDAEGDGLAVITLCPAAATIDAIEFHVASHTTTGTVVGSVQGLLSGLPNDTPVGSSGTVSVTGTGRFAVSGLGAAVAAGDLVALVLRPQTGFGGSFLIRTDLGAGASRRFPYMATANAGVGWTRKGDANFGYAFGARDAGGDVVPLVGCLGPFSGITNVGFSAANYEAGNVFTLPMAARVAGVALSFNVGSTMQAVTARLLTDPLGTPAEAAATALDASTYGANNNSIYMIPFAGTDIAAGAAFAVTVRVDDSNGGSLNYVDHGASDAGKDFLIGDGGTGIFRTSGAAGFTQQADRAYFAWPIVSHLDDGAGGGGGGGGATRLVGGVLAA